MERGTGGHRDVQREEEEEEEGEVRAGVWGWGAAGEEPRCPAVGRHPEQRWGGGLGHRDAQREKEEG